jgi:hypothetical protein
MNRNKKLLQKYSDLKKGLSFHRKASINSNNNNLKDIF